jgi:hypothetical protein
MVSLGTERANVLRLATNLIHLNRWAAALADSAIVSTCVLFSPALRIVYKKGLIFIA